MKHEHGTCHFCGTGDSAKFFERFGIFYDGCNVHSARGILRIWGLNNVRWGERPSEICPCNQHPYQRRENVSVLVCVCGKWPGHHVHLGESPRTCGCDRCRWLRDMAARVTSVPASGPAAKQRPRP